MKIAVFSDNFYPELSGIADSITSLAKELAKRGENVNFYVPHYSKKNYQTARQPYQELDLGEKVRIIRLPSISYPTPTLQGRLVSVAPGLIASLKKWNPDIIHTQLFFGVGLWALRAARLLKKPLVGTNHTAITEFARYVPFGSKLIEQLLIKYAVWYYNRCDFVTAPSQSVFEEMERFGFTRPHLVTSNPIELGNFSPLASADQRRELKIRFGLTGPTLVYAGRLAAEKNIEVIIKALAIITKSLPTAQLAIAGHGTDKNNLEKLARGLGLEKNVKFVGLLDRSALADLYRASDIFVIASTSETQNMTMMQAMGTALPVIGVRARALPEYLNHDNGFVVEPGDSQALAEKAILLLTDGNLRRTMGLNGLNFVQSFTPKKIATIWQSIYQKTILMYNKKQEQKQPTI